MESCYHLELRLFLLEKLQEEQIFLMGSRFVWMCFVPPYFYGNCFYTAPRTTNEQISRFCIYILIEGMDMPGFFKYFIFNIYLSNIEACYAKRISRLSRVQYEARVFKLKNTMETLFSMKAEKFLNLDASGQMNINIYPLHLSKMIDWDKAIMVTLEQGDKFQEGDECAFSMKGSY
ncbi:hypothetical protein J5N97_014389 [Dioscorea zingiberensis]|uniref:Uncharacterized protein n=1 Tax=Dioscorea zingiberensis TaxID=325984 RepID=A0A9D5HJG3_9LILI|nr:hypothetical protein J5N97_014389 [Dioscorea zingiberensis]